MGRPSASLDPGRPAVAWRAVLLIAAVVLAVLLATAGRYGFHRDELYFVEAGHHLAWGYDDQPPLTPLIARAATMLFGATPAGLRVPSALAYAACVLLTALIARELGGGRRAQVAAAASLASSAAIFAGHLVSTTTYDFLAWTVLLYLAVRIVRRDEPRFWLLFGLVLGIALLNKWLPVTLVAALVLGAALAGDLRLLRNRWVLLAVLLAVAVWLPNLVWQSDHGWPQRALARQIGQEDPVGARIKFVPFQLVIISPFLVYLWLAGLRWLLRDAQLRLFGLGYLALVGICLLGGAKEYYALGYFPLLLAAGGVALEQKLAIPARRARFIAAVAVSAAVAAAIQLPLVPQRALADDPMAQVNPDMLETVGWPRFADAVARTWRELPVQQRGSAVIFTANYGEAGALRIYGPSRGLPRAYSGHNSFASFGQPPESAVPVIVVGIRDHAYLQRFFVGCHLAARFDNQLGIDNEEQGAPIDVCAAPRGGWRRTWTQLHRLRA